MYQIVSLPSSLTALITSITSSEVRIPEKTQGNLFIGARQIPLPFPLTTTRLGHSCNSSEGGPHLANIFHLWWFGGRGTCAVRFSSGPRSKATLLYSNIKIPPSLPPSLFRWLTGLVFASAASSTLLLLPLRDGMGGRDDMCEKSLDTTRDVFTSVPVLLTWLHQLSSHQVNLSQCCYDKATTNKYKDILHNTS